jgi:hypothetical protein
MLLRGVAQIRNGFGSETELAWSAASSIALH